jgi:hypothetical protein
MTATELCYGIGRFQPIMPQSSIPERTGWDIRVWRSYREPIASCCCATGEPQVKTRNPAVNPPMICKPHLNPHAAIDRTDADLQDDALR